MTMARYKVGPPVRPAIAHDNGFLDRYRPRPATAADRAQFAKWAAVLEAAEAAQKVPFIPHNDLPDALAAYRHFLYGKGADRIFSYERYVMSDESGRITLENALIDARLGADSLFSADRKLSSFQMCSSAISCGSDDPDFADFFPYPKTENWQKAIGAHSIWLSAMVNVTGPAARPQFAMVVTLHAEDRYNFNPENEDISTGIPDSANGRFEVTGLAKQYMNFSTLVRQVRWEGSSGVKPTVTPYAGGRLRKPSDNRRARNRV
jgi:hypothetical protein